MSRERFKSKHGSRVRQLTLVAEFDDLIRKYEYMRSCLEEQNKGFINYVKDIENKRVLWADSLSEQDRLNKEIQNENATLTTKLKHARSLIETETNRRQIAERECENFERQVTLVREIIKDKHNNNTLLLNEEERSRLAFLNSTLTYAHNKSNKNGLSNINESNDSILSPDISFDKTDEDAVDISVLRSGKRWKRPSTAPFMPKDTLSTANDECPPKKRGRSGKSQHRRSKSAEIHAKVTVDKHGHFEAEAEITNGIKKKKIRHSSGQLPSEFISPSVSTGTLRKAFGSASSLTRPHNFQNKTILRQEPCGVCDKKMRFGKSALKCKDCKATVHVTCRDELPLPCLSIATPGSPTHLSQMSLTNIKLADLAPYYPPFVPAFVVHCVREIETRGLTEKGIYRLSGNDKEVKELKEKFFRGRSAPNLSIILDIHVICACLKDFLRSLSEPLLTYALWEKFVLASEKKSDSEAEAFQAISELPQINRDTLAYLILHLQKVSESSQTGMTISSLSKMFGPSIVGYSNPEPEPMQMISETHQQQAVMERLLTIQNDYWSRFIDFCGDVSTPGSNLNNNYPTPSTLTPTCPPRSARRKPTKYFGPLE